MVQNCVGENGLLSGQKAGRSARGIWKKWWETGMGKYSGKHCSARNCSLKFRWVCHNSKKIEGFTGYILRYLEWALNDGPLARFGPMGSGNVRHTHPGKHQAKRNDEYNQN
jgi:hypothetical protein